MGGILPTGTVTLFFSDVEASTRLVQELSPQRWSEVLLGYRALVRDAFARHRGVEIDTQGDAFSAVFPAAIDAAAACARIHRASCQPPWSALPLRTRIGLHTAEPMSLGDQYVGVDVHRA